VGIRSGKNLPSAVAVPATKSSRLDPNFDPGSMPRQISKAAEIMTVNPSEMSGRKPGSMPINFECKRGLKHDLHRTEPIRAIEPPDQEVVLANASGEVPLQEDRKTFHLRNVWGQVSLTPCTKLAEDPKSS